MKLANWRVIVGGLLVVIGVMALLDTIAVFPFTDVLWSVIFGFGGLAFLVYMFSNREAWWAIIPGVVLLSLGSLIFLDAVFPRWGGRIGGTIFLAGVALAFWLVYAMRREFWWAIIPAGVMTSLSLTAFVDEFTRLDGGFVFLFGLAVTFALLAVLPGLPGNRQWPYIPAGILFLVSVMVLFANLNWMSYFLAVLLIAAGVFLVVRTVIVKKE